MILGHDQLESVFIIHLLQLLHSERLSNPAAWQQMSLSLGVRSLRIGSQRVRL